MARTRFVAGAVCALAALTCGTSPATTVLAGRPPITRFAPDIGTYPQNFAVAEDRDSIVYIGNASGVLAFDGTRWQLIGLPGGGRVRALAYDGDRRVYAGGLNAFGYIERNAAGRGVFHDLTPLFKKDLHGQRFGDIWDVVIGKHGVLFAGLRDLFLYDPATGRTHYWHTRMRLGAVTGAGNKLLVQFRGVGLEYLDGSRWRLIPGGAAIQWPVYRMLSLPDGGLLLLAGDGRWRSYRDGRVEAFSVPQGFPASSHFTGGCVLGDGTLALITDAGDIYFLAPGGRRASHVSISSGYLSGVIRANGGGLLTVDDHGLYHIEWPAPWTRIGSSAGLTGSIHDLVHWGKQWLALTTAGVFRAVSNSADGITSFTPTGWTSIEAIDLLPVDGNSALLATPYALDEVHAGRVAPIASLYPLLLVRSAVNPDIVYVGTEGGIAVVARDGDRWHLRLEHEAELPRGTNSIVEAAPHRLWIGSELGGAELITLTDDDRHVLKARQFTSADGLQYGAHDPGADVTRLENGTVVVTTARGEYRWNGRRFVTDDLGGLDKLRQSGERLNLAVAPDGTLWAWSWKHLYRRDAHGWRRESIAKLRDGIIEALTFDADGAALVSAGDSILRYQQVPAKPQPDRPRTLLRNVELTRRDGTHRYLPLGKAAPLRFGQGDFALTFNFAMPDYVAPGAVRYEARLIGIESTFSDWSPSDHYTYSHLRAGDYRFEVRGRDSEGRVTAAAPFSFTIVPPWYARRWVEIGWLLAAAALLLVTGACGIRWRTHRLAVRATDLARLVAERTRELEAANKQLRTMAHLDSLTGIPNRRRLEDYLEKVWTQCRERQRPLSVLLIDVDHFKAYNDLHGHPAGDTALKRLVTILSLCLRRAEDLLARYGGEEFLAVLPGASADVAQGVAEHMRASVADADIDCTISVGLATRLAEAELTVWDVVEAADRALYEAKSAGRNRTVADFGR